MELTDSFGHEGLVRLRDFLVDTDLSENQSMDDLQLQSALERQLGSAMADLLLSWEY